MPRRLAMMLVAVAALLLVEAPNGCSASDPAAGTAVASIGILSLRQPRNMLSGGPAAAGAGAASSGALHGFLADAVSQLRGGTGNEPEATASSASSAAAPLPGTTTFVADLPLGQSRVGYGSLGLNGDLGFEGGHVTAKGVRYAHGVSMHTFSAPGFSFAAFDLAATAAAAAGSRRVFKAGVAINDKNNFFGRAGSPVTFVVLAADGEGGEPTQLWHSHPIQKTGDVDTCEVDIPAAATKLTLEAHASGSNACSHAVWLDPQVVVSPPAPTASAGR